MAAQLSLQSTASTLPLQFGIEIETILVFPRTFPRRRASSILSEHLDHLNLPYIRVITSDRSYPTWQLTEDPAVLPDQPTVTSADEVHSSLEVVSPPMPALSTDSRDVEEPQQQQEWQNPSRYFSAILGPGGRHPAHSAYTNNTCGFHIHFGLRGNVGFPFGLLQQLAYLTLFYEDVFSALHPGRRNPHTGKQARQFAMSNRQAFCRCAFGVHTDMYQPCAMFDFDIARQRIMDAENTGALAYLMGAPYPLTDGLRPAHEREQTEFPSHRYPSGVKYKVVRWDLLPPPKELQAVRGDDESEKPQTIEFRQSAGTLDSREAAFTVQLYTAVMRAAERMAREEVSVREQTPTLGGLLEVLGLGVVSKRYWYDRAASLERERETSEQETSEPETQGLVHGKPQEWQDQGPQRSTPPFDLDKDFPPLGETVSTASTTRDAVSTASLRRPK